MIFDTAHLETAPLAEWLSEIALQCANLYAYNQTHATQLQLTPSEYYYLNELGDWSKNAIKLKINSKLPPHTANLR